MVGGQNTGSDGCTTTYSKVGSDERTAAGDEEGTSSGGMLSTKADEQSTRSERCTAVCSSFLTMMRNRTTIDMKSTVECSEGSYSYVVPVLDSTEITTRVTWREETMRYRTPCVVNCNKGTSIDSSHSRADHLERRAADITSSKHRRQFEGRMSYTQDLCQQVTWSGYVVLAKDTGNQTQCPCQ
jgi:hypothetical protein